MWYKLFMISKNSDKSFIRLDLLLAIICIFGILSISILGYQAYLFFWNYFMSIGENLWIF